MTFLPKLRAKITEHGILPGVRSIDRGRPDTVGQRHIDFAPTYQLGGKRPALWVIVADAGNFFLEGWNDDATLLVRKQLPAGFVNTTIKGMAQGSDDWIYTVKEKTPPGTGIWNRILRMKIVDGTLSTEVVGDMAGSLELAYGFRSNFVDRPIMAGPDGKVYVHTWDNPFHDANQPRGSHLRRIDSIATAWEFPIAKTNYLAMTFGMGTFSFVTRLGVIYRAMLPCSVSGRWVAVDPMPYYEFSSSQPTSERSWAGTATGPHPNSTGVTKVSHLWGNGYWEAAMAGDAWSPVAAPTTSGDVTMTRFDLAPQERDEVGDPQSVHHAQRVTLATLGAALPVYDGISMYGWTSDAVSFRVLSTSAYHLSGFMVGDNQFLYLGVGGQACLGGFCPDAGSAPDREGIWRSPLPGLGGLPTWTRILSLLSTNLVSAAGFLWFDTDKRNKAGTFIASRPQSGNTIQMCGDFRALWK